MGPGFCAVKGFFQGFRAFGELDKSSGFRVWDGFRVLGFIAVRSKAYAARHTPAEFLSWVLLHRCGQGTKAKTLKRTLGVM